MLEHKRHLYRTVEYFYKKSLKNVFKRFKKELHISANKPSGLNFHHYRCAFILHPDWEKIEMIVCVNWHVLLVDIELNRTRNIYFFKWEVEQL